MRVLVVGATGVVGSRLVTRLREDGHDVVGTTRSPAKLPRLQAAGAEGVVLDALDGDAVREVVGEARPDVIVHEATALTGLGTDMRRFDREFALTNRLRTEATDHLLAAAIAVGVPRFVAQSYASLLFARQGTAVKAEDAPLDPHPPREARRVFAAIRHLEARVTGTADLAGVVLRYGGLYGPGTSLGRGGVHLEAVRRRRFPLIGDGGGVWSFLHADDAAAATARAVVAGEPGIYHVVDDEPAPVREWLPYLAETIGARPPYRIPAWLARLAAGELAVAMMTQARGASNAKAKGALAWKPRWSSWRDGFRHALG